MDLDEASTRGVDTRARRSVASERFRRLLELDGLLIERVRSGSEPDFTKLYGLLLPHVYGFARRRLESDGETEDVTREVLEIVLRSSSDGHRSPDVLVWIFGIVSDRVSRRLADRRATRGS